MADNSIVGVVSEFVDTYFTRAKHVAMVFLYSLTCGIVVHLRGGALSNEMNFLFHNAITDIAGLACVVTWYSARRGVFAMARNFVLRLNWSCVLFSVAASVIANVSFWGIGHFGSATWQVYMFWLPVSLPFIIWALLGKSQTGLQPVHVALIGQICLAIWLWGITLRVEYIGVIVVVIVGNLVHVVSLRHSGELGAMDFSEKFLYTSAASAIVAPLTYVIGTGVLSPVAGLPWVGTFNASAFALLPITVLHKFVTVALVGRKQSSQTIAGALIVTVVCGYLFADVGQSPRNILAITLLSIATGLM